MAKRRTRVVLSVVWDDEEEGHPCNWGYDVLLGRDEDVLVVDFEDLENPIEEETL